MCMERLLFFMFCSTPYIRKAINSLLLFGNKLNKKHSWTKFSLLPPWKIEVGCGTEPSLNASFISTKLYSSLIFLRASSSSSFLFTKFSSKILKYPQPLVLINLLNHLLVQVLGEHQAVHRFYHQGFFILHALLLFFLLMFVFENHINY